MVANKIVLISTDESRAGIGVKSLSSCLVREGFDTTVILMPTPRSDFRDFYWDDLIELCQDALLVGFSCMTHGVKKATEIKRAISEKVSAPVVIGGVHASLDPESLINEFGLVCHGEGEDLIVELAKRIRDKMPIKDIPGLWARDNGRVIRNHAVPLMRDLNSYPFPDYQLSRQKILEERHLVPMRPVAGHIQSEYFVVLGSRGCPHHCAYCSNDKQKKEFPWRQSVRHYTTGYLIGHLKEASRVFPQINSFWIDDDSFFAKPLEEIAEFSRRYKEEVGKPFLVLISPWTFNERKAELLISAGLKRITMGIQSGSENVNYNLYDRRLPNKDILRIVRSLNTHSEKLVPSYDFIILNPFEGRDDLIATIRLIKSFPPPFFIFNNTLAFYPGTRLYEEARRRGLEVDIRNKHMDLTIGYRILKNERFKHKLFHFILLLMGGSAGKRKIGLVLRLFISEPLLGFYFLLDKKTGSLLDLCVAAICSPIYLVFREISESEFLYKLARRLAGIYLKVR